MRPTDLFKLPAVSAPSVHPDGSWAVVAASYPSLDADAYVGQLWRIDLTGGEPPRRLTRGMRDASPRFSPDGSLIAFVRKLPDAPGQLYVVASGGGEPVQVTDAKIGVGSFAFSPDGRTLAYVARVPEAGRYGTLDGVGASAEDPRHITSLKFQSNGLGWTNDRRSQLFVVDVPDPFGEPYVAPTGRAAKALADATLAAASDPDAALAVPTAVPASTQLTDFDADVDSPAFLPDGTLVAESARHDGRDLDIHAELFAFALDPGAEPRPLASGCNLYEACGTPGATFAIGADLGDSGRDFVGKLGGVFLVADGAARRLTDADGVQVEHGLAPYGADGVVTVYNDRGTLRPLTVLADGTVTRWPSGEASVLAAAELPGRPGSLVVTVATFDSPGEVGVLDADGSLALLSDFGGRLREAGAAVRPVELTATASDGYPVHGWVWLPEGEGPHPVVLNIHGGPHSTYGPTFFDEFQVYARAGYAVVACNPRGSGGYGLHHGRVIKDAMGGLDASDIECFLDHALATIKGLDAARVGVCGGSYGGYMTAWLIGHSDRFTAAIVERGFLDTESFVGHSDIGWWFIEEYNGTDAAHRVTQSPMTFVDKVRTPTLVVHSEDDLRCPLGPALRYYTTLKLGGVDAELLVFPGENHELSRSGTPHHRLARFDAALDWWNRHLPIKPPA